MLRWNPQWNWSTASSGQHNWIHTWWHMALSGLDETCAHSIIVIKGGHFCHLSLSAEWLGWVTSHGDWSKPQSLEGCGESNPDQAKYHKVVYKSRTWFNRKPHSNRSCTFSELKLHISRTHRCRSSKKAAWCRQCRTTSYRFSHAKCLCAF